MNDRLVQAYREPSSLIMSGVESDSYWGIAVSAGIEKVLVSYHYIQKRGMKFIRERLKDAPNVKLMVDSGAYTFHTNEEEYRKKPMEWWENYVQKYTETVRKNADIIFSCVNLDIANIVGQEKVEEWNEKYFRPLEDLGVLVCHVWHEFDGDAMWEEMCRKYRYVGFSLAVGDIDEAKTSRMFNIAKKYNTLVHGFAITRVELMSRFPFYTGDSTTWLVGTKFGELNWFDGRRMIRLKKAQWKRQYKVKFIKLGANWELAEKENPYELIRINLLVFLKAQEYIRARIRPKQYWINRAAREMPKKEGKTVGIFKKSTAASTPKARPKPKLNLKKGAQERDDLAAEGKSKYDEFMEAQQNATKKKPVRKVVLKRAAKPQKPNIPSKEWFDGDMSDWAEIAESLNIAVENYTEDEVKDLLWDFYIFLAPDEEELAKVSDDVLLDTAKFYTEQEYESREESVEALRTFYRECAEGTNNFFRKTEEFVEDTPPPRPQERDEYLEDEEYDIVDVKAEEIESTGMLPPPEDASMEEVAAYDEELRKNMGIIAVRDEKGRFLKGQKIVRKPKQIYSKHFPKLACNTCYKAGDCPEYKPDHACAFEKIFNKFDTRNVEDIIDAMAGMANLNLGRMQRLAMFEIMDGGMPDPSLTAMIDQNMKLMTIMKQLIDSQRKPAVIAQQTTRINADGTKETETVVSNPSQGILYHLFMNKNVGTTDMPEDDDPKRKIIDAEVVEVVNDQKTERAEK